jgi:hypothetical protein
MPNNRLRTIPQTSIAAVAPTPTINALNRQFIMATAWHFKQT